MRSDQQQAVIDFAQNGKGSLNLVARAGCGKTYTLLELVQHLLQAAPNSQIFLGAYNKPIAVEIGQKLTKMGVEGWKQTAGRWIAPRAQASTMHSAGFTAWKKVAPNTTKKDAINGRKLDSILDEYIRKNPDSEESINIDRPFLVKAVSLAKQRAFGVLCAIEDRGKWFDLIDHFGLDEDLAEDTDMDRLVTRAITLYKESLELCYSSIDFDDMILAPLYFKTKVWQYDWVLIDEAQDTNPARRALALKMLKPSGRLVAVGDPAQAIYGFTGADSDSMNIIRRELNSAELPLNLTYRCPKAVVRIAQQWVPDITAHETAPEGIVRSIFLAPRPGSERATFDQEILTNDDVILCRNNKPLVEMAYALIRKGTPCRVEGRAIGEGLVQLISKWKATTINALVNKLSDYRDKEVQKWLAKGKEEKAAAVDDKCETILVIAQKLLEEGKTAVTDLVSFIKGLFGDTREGEPQQLLTLSSVHKSKGREWNRVYLLGRAKYMPSKYARKEWQQEQEANLMYVAVTRSKNELVEIIVEN